MALFSKDMVRVEPVSRFDIDDVRELNERIFKEPRIINSFRHEVMLILVAYWKKTPIGFKLGYEKTSDLFYSAKGGVLLPYRGQGVATLMLYEMMKWCRDHGYTRLGYDTFPDKWPGMYQLGLKEGFTVLSEGWSNQYKTKQFYLEKTVV